MSDIVVKIAAAPLSITAVVSVKLEPLIVTLAPTGPDVGVKLEIVGITEKIAALVLVPPALVTLTDPVLAPAGTVV